MRETQTLLVVSHAETGSECSRGEDAERRSPFVWLNLVCLDAPIVAVAWQWLFGRSFHIPFVNSTRVALFLTAWLIYLADRLADIWTLSATDRHSLRQEFCRRHQRMWMAAIVGITVVDLCIITRQLDRPTICVGLLIGSLSIVYLTVNYWLGKIWRFLPVKEICIGSLFAVGTLVALFSRMGLSGELMAPFFLFAALCSLNCIFIAVWERDLDRMQHKDSIATRWSGIRSFLKPAAFALVAIAIAVDCLSKTAAQLYGCIGVSAALLGVLDWLGKLIPCDERTALADIVLLTPLLLLVLGSA